ncbi:13833_t:CDS:2, partial [Racocetra fulgida]
AGEMMTGELKERCIKVLQKFVGDFQQRKSEVTEETLKAFMDPNRKILLEKN